MISRAPFRRAEVLLGLTWVTAACALAGCGGVSRRADANRPHPPEAGVYAAVADQRLSPRLRALPSRVYVPVTYTGGVVVIDARNYRVLFRDQAGLFPQHVIPGWDMRDLFVANSDGGPITRIDPRSGRVSGSVPRTAAAYNLYFTPDGQTAVVVAELANVIEFRDRRTWRLKRRLRIPWRGVNHLDFSGNGRYLLASCEFAGMAVKVDLRRYQIAGELRVGGSPLDVRLAPDGREFLIANQLRDGVSVVDGSRLRQTRFVPTGAGAHGLALSRDASAFYVSNQRAGTITLLDSKTFRTVGTWRVGGSPDMLQVSADGRELWFSNRFADTVAVLNTMTGRVVHTIHVGLGPHGLALFPQPGRYSTGHNGNYR